MKILPDLGVKPDFDKIRSGLCSPNWKGFNKDKRWEKLR